jgi:endonuclease/exonuclease/phosphatase family metal-dependent hydrolase
MPAAAIVLGDFNMAPESAEYQTLCGASGGARLIDAWALHNPGREVKSWHSNPAKKGPAESALLDYCLVSDDLAARVSACWIDEAAGGPILEQDIPMNCSFIASVAAQLDNALAGHNNMP